MNKFIGWTFLVLSILIGNDVIHMAHDKVTFQVAMLVFAGIFFLRQEVKDLRDLVLNDKQDEGDRPHGFTPRQG